MLSIVAFGVFSAWLYGEEAVVRSGDRNRAVLLASEGADIVRNIRDGDFGALIDGTYSLQKTDISWKLVPGDLEKIGPYSRVVTITSTDTKHKKVKVTVYWSGVGGVPQEVTFDTVLTRWHAAGQFALGGSTSPPAPGECSDGIDNDSDGFIDSLDWGCFISGNTTETSLACADLIDNDSDGLTDWPADPGCSNSADDDETNSGGGGGGGGGPSVIASKESLGVTKIQRRQGTYDDGFVYGITGEVSKNPNIYYFDINGLTGAVQLGQTFTIPNDIDFSPSASLTNLYVTENWLYVTTSDPNNDLLIFSIDQGIITLRQAYNILIGEDDKSTATDVHVTFTSGSTKDDYVFVTFTNNATETFASLSVHEDMVVFPPTDLGRARVVGGGVEICGKDNEFVFVGGISDAGNSKPIFGISISDPVTPTIVGTALAAGILDTSLAISCPAQWDGGFLSIADRFVNFKISDPYGPITLGTLGSLSVGASFTDIALDANSSGYVFAATNDEKNPFKIINVNDAAEPTIANVVDTESLTGVAYDPNFGYAYAVGATTFYVIDPAL